MAELIQIFVRILLFNCLQTQLEEPDILLEVFYPDGMDTVTGSLDDLEDIKSQSELKFNKNIKLKLNNETNRSVNNGAGKIKSS